MSNQTIKEKIRQRRAQMLVHSCIYYELDDSIVTDDKWQQWADELTLLQNDNPDDCSIGFYDREFEEWNGSSGAFLPLKDSYVYSKAKWLLTQNNSVQTTQDVVEYTNNLEDFM